MDGNSRRKLVVVGQGYVGLPLAMRAVEVGWDVVGLDVDDARVKRLLSGESYVEDIPDAELAAALASGRYLPTADYENAAGFDVAVITVPTPLREGNPDLTYIEESTASLARQLRAAATVVLESTTYPGTTEELVAPILESISGLRSGHDFHLGYSPERIDPGNPTWTFITTPKVVSGIDPSSLAAVQGFYDTLIDQTVPVASTRVAELTKLLENTFRHVNIALVNELAMYSHDLGIDVWEAIDAASSKPFGFMKFTPGPGVGGHCLPIDPSYLSWQVKRSLGQPFRFVELANDVNDHMPDYVVRRVVTALNRDSLAVRGTRILLLGLAYKKNTGDARESPATRIAELLVSLGADLHACDPHVVESPALSALTLVDLTPDELASADLVVLLTDHDSFDFDLVGRHAKNVLDCRNATGIPDAEIL
ncbi:MAG: putative UDP-glucose/GDP-mannose dehydrogenase [Hyphomicrobiales bacterium]|nr:putative UDP-glucose/GDP-mannose dehydrogenase [Hyphomicrobiales bacterium]